MNKSIFTQQGARQYVIRQVGYDSFLEHWMQYETCLNVKVHAMYNIIHHRRHHHPNV